MARRLFQYRLRTLLLFALSIAVVSSVYGWHLRATAAQRRAAEEIAAKGGFVWFDVGDRCIDIEFQIPLHEGCGQIHLWAAPSLNGPPFGEADLPLLDQLPHVREIRFAHTNLSPTAINEFRRSHPQCKVIE